MLLYKEGRFHALGVAFLLPDGFLLDTEAEDAVQYGLSAFTPDEKYRVQWEIEEGCRGTAEELQELFGPESGITALSDIMPASAGGLSGHQVMYRTGSDERLEHRFAVGGGVELSVCVAAKSGSIAGVKDARFMKDILAGIEVD